MTSWKPGDSYCGTELEAINFVCDKLTDTYMAQEFLRSWREGDLGEWPEFEFEPQVPTADWKPIMYARRTAGTILDLWVVSDENPTGYRIPDCHPAAGGRESAWVNSAGRYVNGLTYYDDEGDECFAAGNDPQPEEKVVREKHRSRVTHWMVRPAPPSNL